MGVKPIVFRNAETYNDTGMRVRRFRRVAGTGVAWVRALTLTVSGSAAVPQDLTS